MMVSALPAMTVQDGAMLHVSVSSKAKYQKNGDAGYVPRNGNDPCLLKDKRMFISHKISFLLNKLVPNSCLMLNLGAESPP